MIIRRFVDLYAYFNLVCIGAKSRFKSLFGMALGSFAAPLIIAAAFVAAGPLIAGAFTQPKLDLVFCDLEGSAYFDTILNLLLADESVTKTASIRKLEYDEALSELDSGAADAVIIFPEAFLSDMAMGINHPIKILSGESDPVRSVFIKEFIQSAADELSAAQSAINTVWFNMDLERMNDLRRNIAFTTLVLDYTSKAFARSVYYTFHNVSQPYEASSPAAFLTASALAAVIFFGSLSGIKQIIDERMTGITARLAASRLSCARVAFYHFAPIYIKQLMCACFAVLIALPAVSVAVSASAVNPVAPADAVMADDATADGDTADGATSGLGGIINNSLGAGARSGAGADGSADKGGESAYGSPDGGASENGTFPDRIPDGQLNGDRSASDDTAGIPGYADGGRAGASFGLSDIPNMIRLSATKENATRFINAFWIICVLCLFTSALSLFFGCMLKRAESAEVLIVTSGIVMAVAGGTVIPYPFLPEIYTVAGRFCYNRHAQVLLASALFGGVPAASQTTVLAIFACIAIILIAASAIKISADRR